MINENCRKHKLPTNMQIKNYFTKTKQKKLTN